MTNSLLVLLFMFSAALAGLSWGLAASGDFTPIGIGFSVYTTLLSVYAAVTTATAVKA